MAYGVANILVNAIVDIFDNVNVNSNVLADVFDCVCVDVIIY